MRPSRWAWIVLSLTACARPMPGPVPRPLPPPERTTQAPPVKAPAPDTSACRQTCRRDLLECQDSPTQCDQRYSRCLSRC